MTEEEQVMVDYERALSVALKRCKDYATLAAFQTGKTENDLVYFESYAESGYLINAPGYKWVFFFDHFEAERQPAVEVGMFKHSRHPCDFEIYALEDGQDWLNGKPVRSDEYWCKEE